MSPENVTLGLAFLAGMASFLSPCVLALVPAYVGYLGGRSVTADGTVIENRWTTLSHGVAFVLGFSIVFVLLGAAASALGAFLFDARQWLSRIGGVVVVLFGLHMLGVIRIPFLDMDTRRQVRPDPKLGYLSSVLMGVFFSAGWSPCVGPVLGAVLTLALNSAKVTQGAVLLTAYSAGLAIPFLLAALGVGRVTLLMRRHARLVRGISMAPGVIMIILGIMLLTGTLSQLARFGFFVDLGR
ncbi:MAG: cytochrome c biogenesis protein CcdA [Anaerolineales bacterium]|nr:cytochrome c biogenesis protein CcdA [Anaerolineales bacterium]